MWNRASSSVGGQTKLFPATQPLAPAASVRGRETASPMSVPAAPTQQKQSHHLCHAKHLHVWPPCCLRQGPSDELQHHEHPALPGMPSLQGEKVSRESNSLYLWLSTAAFNSLE